MRRLLRDGVGDGVRGAREMIHDTIFYKTYSILNRKGTTFEPTNHQWEHLKKINDQSDSSKWFIIYMKDNLFSYFNLSESWRAQVNHIFIKGYPNLQKKQQSVRFILTCIWYVLKSNGRKIMLEDFMAQAKENTFGYTKSVLLRQYKVILQYMPLLKIEYETPLKWYLRVVPASPEWIKTTEVQSKIPYRHKDTIQEGLHRGVKMGYLRKKKVKNYLMWQKVGVRSK